MSDELKAAIERLEKKFDEAKKPAWGKMTIGTIITIVVLIVGSAVSWGTLRAEVVDLKEDLTKVELVQDKQQDEIADTKLKGVQDSADIKHIKEKVGEIDKNLKVLLEK